MFTALLMTTFIKADEAVHLENGDTVIFSQESRSRLPTEYETQAYKQPGMKVVIWEKSFRPSGFFHRIKVSTSQQTVRYDTEKKQLVYSETELVTQDGEPQFRIHKTFILLAMIMIVLGGVTKIFFTDAKMDHVVPVMISVISNIFMVSAGLTLMVETQVVFGLSVLTILITGVALVEHHRSKCMYLMHCIALFGVHVIALVVV